MQETSLLVGGYCLKLMGCDTLRLFEGLPGMHVFHFLGGFADMQLQLDADVPLPECRWLHSFDIADGASVCRFGIDAEGVYYYTFDANTRLRFDARRPDIVECTTVTDASLLRFAVWVAYSMMGLHAGALPVHSSVVVHNGQAVMSLGESGTGKSTHTRLWIEHIPNTFLLNDDSPILNINGDIPMVFGSPWSGKTPCFRTEHYPLAALLRLEQSPENSIRRLATVEAFTALQPSCPPSMAKDERCLDLLVDFISKVVCRVPVYRMGCLPDADAAKMSCKTIFSDDAD